MAPAAPAYCQVSQDDEAAQLNHDASSPTSWSPAPSTSPMPFLPTAKTLTPLSMTSDDDLLHVHSLKPISEEDAAPTPVSPSHSGRGAPTTTYYEPQARATAASPSTPTAAPNSVAPGSRQNSVTNQTCPAVSQAPTFLSSTATQAAPVLACQKPSSSLSIESVPGPAAAVVAAAAAARARSATTTTTTIRHHLQSLSPESSSTSGIIRPQPILRTASTKSVSLRHPAPDITLPSSRAGSIAHLEATAERLSMTSSIEDAIRDLHDEQKRIDSRRSSILAASISPFTDDCLEQPSSFARQVSSTSSILEINTAARQGGYSPAAYVLSPTSSIRSTASRLRSASTGLYKTTNLEDMEETTSPLSRQGPGKGSVHSVRSAGKPAVLTDIAELEPTTLTKEAMNAADQLPGMPTGNDSTHRMATQDRVDHISNAHQFDDQAAMDYWDQAIADSNRPPVQSVHEEDGRSIYAGSTGTYEQAERAFADFDGTHASPDADTENEDLSFRPSFGQIQQGRVSFLMPLDHNIQDEERVAAASDLATTRPPQRQSASMRPKSYLDPETGNTMLYYPARVPMMLNVPQRLSQKPKAETRNKRRTQVLADMSDANRKSGIAWLPEFHNEPLMDSMLDPTAHASDAQPTAETAATTPELPSPSPRLDQAGETQPMLRENPPARNDEARKSQMSTMPNMDRRKSRMSNMDMLPPQLRASAFFDLPSETTNLELKDGSASATLDSILDASAAAPVSAFTDHAFAGTLGSEIYGTEKKRRSTIDRLSTADPLGAANRRSQMHLRKPSALSRHSRMAESVRSGSLKSNGGHNDERTRLSGSIDGRHRDNRDSEEDDDEHNQEKKGEEEEEEEEEEVYYGPPTTLLAELQIRKQQQKLRTRAPAQAYPNGMYSTLLEMDAVKEVEHKARKGKKINLAWEAPRAGDEGESDDEDLPLGLILATKSQGNLAAAVAELNRPMGLMEKREMEENEPLAQRRNRLLGPNAPPVRQPHNIASGMSHARSPRLNLHTPEEEEHEEETLGARKARLLAQEKSGSALPEARPVSTAFSMELLGAFKGDEAESASKDKEPTGTGEEEETLGQRRRRLQAEREARDHEMGAGGMLGISVPNEEPLPLRLPKKHSMADVLGAHGNRVVSDDPRLAVEKMKAADGERYKQEQERKFAAYRDQLPTNLSTPNVQTPGGYMSGRFNDGTGGGLGQPRATSALGAYSDPKPQTGNPYLMNAVAPVQNYMQPGYQQQVYGGQPGFMAPSYSNPALGMQGFAPQIMNPYGMPMPGQPQPLDRVEQWRHGVSQ
ncbi:hypothetical protein MN608_01418 [Microdochium nivale]|nr:hypothetical protein MN608_01418 [Microdochium nivale]